MSFVLARVVVELIFVQPGGILCIVWRFKSMMMMMMMRFEIMMMMMISRVDLY